MRGRAASGSIAVTRPAPHPASPRKPGYDLHTSLAGGRIGPSPSSRFAAAPLCFARFAVTAPRRCGEAHPWSLLSEAGPQGRLPAAKTMKTKSLSRAEGSRLATPGLDPEGATREAGAAKGRPKERPSFDRLWTPSPDRAQRTKTILNCDV